MSTAASSDSAGGTGPAPEGRAASDTPPHAGTGPPTPRLGPVGWLRVVCRASVVAALTSVVVALVILGTLPARILPRPGAAWTARVQRWGLQTWGRGMMRACSVRVACEGAPPPQGSLVVSNHLGYLDIPVLSSVVPMVFVAKAGLRRWPFWGFAATAGGTIFVNRSTKRDVLRVRREMRDAQARGSSVIVFPEATSTAGDTILPLKPALLADAAARGAPVYWLTVSYRTPPGSPPARDRVCWWGDMGFVPHVLGLFALRRIHCTVRFGEGPVRSTDRKAMAVELRRAMLRRFEPVGSRGAGRGAADDTP